MENEGTPKPDLADRLRVLGQIELGDVEIFLADWSDWECGALLIEACRCLDYAHVMQILAQPPGDYLPAPDFDIIRRGWNVLLGLLPRVGKFSGIPAAASTEDSQRMTVMGLWVGPLCAWPAGRRQFGSMADDPGRRGKPAAPD